MNGDLATVRSRTTLSENGCWVWQQAVNNKGYAISKIENKTRTVHRWVSQLINGPIPARMQVDHRCGVRSCVNPDHLEVCTPQVNALRALARLGCVGMTAIGGALHDSPRLVVASVEPAPVQETTDVTPAVRRLRAANADAAWHDLLAAVYAAALEGGE